MVIRGENSEKPSTGVLKKKKKKRLAKYRQWAERSTLDALQAVRDGNFGVNHAALEYAVPHTSLKDRLSESHSWIRSWS